MKYKNLIAYSVALLLFLAYSSYGQKIIFGGGWKANMLPDSNSAFSDTTSVGDWLLVGGYGLFADEDSSMVYSYVPKNLIANGSFESYSGGGLDDGLADTFTGWSHTSNEGRAEATATAKEGSIAVKLVRTSGSTIYQNKVYTEVSVTAGRNYTLKFYTRGDGTNSGWFSIYDISNSSYIINYTSTGISGTAYQAYEYSFTTPSGCSDIRIQLANGTGSGSVVYYDYVFLYEVFDENYIYLPLTGLKKKKYRVQFDYKDVTNTDKIYYSFAGTIDSTEIVSANWQTETKVLKSNVAGNDTLKLWLNKQAKVKIDNVKIFEAK